MNQTLRILQTQHPLPEEWGGLQVFEDALGFGEAVLYRLGLSLEGGCYPQISGASATLNWPASNHSDRRTTERAYFELLERAYLLEAEKESLRSNQALYSVLNHQGQKIKSLTAPALFQRPTSGDQSWVYSRSNGVALHTSLPAAIEGAGFELLERDRVLRFWYERRAPSRLPENITPWPLLMSEKYALESYLFADERDLEQGLAVVGIFGFPRVGDLPLIMGFGARAHLLDACEKARHEVYQRLAFMVDEPIPTELPEATQSPSYHLDYYQCPQSWPYLRAWLRGELSPVALPSVACVAPQWPELTFVSLLPESSQRLFLVKAMAEGCVPLTFGVGHPPIGISMEPPLIPHPIA